MTLQRHRTAHACRSKRCFSPFTSLWLSIVFYFRFRLLGKDGNNCNRLSTLPTLTGRPQAPVSPSHVHICLGVSHDCLLNNIVCQLLNRGPLLLLHLCSGLHRTRVGYGGADRQPSYHSTVERPYHWPCCNPLEISHIPEGGLGRKPCPFLGLTMSLSSVCLGLLFRTQKEETVPFPEWCSPSFFARRHGKKRWRRKNRGDAVNIDKCPLTP